MITTNVINTLDLLGGTKFDHFISINALLLLPDKPNLITSKMFNFEERIVIVNEGINLLLDNRFEEGIEFWQKNANHDVFSAHIHSFFLGLKLILDSGRKEEANIASQQVLHMCDTIRPLTFRDNFFVNLFFKTNYAELGDAEIWAELIRTEQMIFEALSDFFDDLTMLGLLKLSYRMRACNQIYKSLYKILKSKRWSSDVSRREFEAGVKFGFGLFNLIISMLPERLLSLISVIGFKASRRKALKMLNESAATDSFHSWLAKLAICFFECFFVQMFSTNALAASASEEIVLSGLRLNPDCYWFLIFKGRLHLIQHDVPAALEAYERLSNIKVDLTKWKSCYTFETMICYIYLGNWPKALDCAHRFCENWVWSKSAAYYMEAICLYMMIETRLIADDSEVFLQSKECSQMRTQIDSLFSEVLRNTRRIAGRRFPIEKYVCDQVKKYRQNGILVAPAYDIFVVWNLFTFIEGQTKLIEPMLSHIEGCLRKYKFNVDVDENRMLLWLLSGIFHRLLGKFDQAETELLKIVNRINDITNDKRLRALALLELGIVNLGKQNFDNARHLFERCQSDFLSFELSLPIQLRLHQAMKQLPDLHSQSID